MGALPCPAQSRSSLNVPMGQCVFNVGCSPRQSRRGLCTHFCLSAKTSGPFDSQFLSSAGKANSCNERRKFAARTSWDADLTIPHHHHKTGRWAIDVALKSGGRHRGVLEGAVEELSECVSHATARRPISYARLGDLQFCAERVTGLRIAPPARRACASAAPQGTNTGGQHDRNVRGLPLVWVA